MKKRQQFTLIELLTVIAIITILAGLAMPAVIGAYKNSIRTKAKEEMASLKLACSYLLDQAGSLPGTGSGSITNISAYKDLIAELSLVNENGTPYTPILNKRRTILLDVSSKNRTFLDPWKEPYQVFYDVDFNNNTIVENHSGDKGFVGKVFVYSKGPDKKGGTSDDILSWD